MNERLNLSNKYLVQCVNNHYYNENGYNGHYNQYIHVVKPIKEIHSESETEIKSDLVLLHLASFFLFSFSVFYKKKILCFAFYGLE